MVIVQSFSVIGKDWKTVDICPNIVYCCAPAIKIGDQMTKIRKYASKNLRMKKFGSNMEPSKSPQ